MNPTEHKSETPETDAAVGASWPAKAVMTCRKLELERDQLRARVGKLEKALDYSKEWMTGVLKSVAAKDFPGHLDLNPQEVIDAAMKGQE